MLRSSSAYLVAGFWVGLYVLHIWLQRYRKYSRKYREFLENNSITFSFCQIKWYTTRFNRLFLHLGRGNGNLLQMWFNLGIAAGLVTMFLSVVVLSMTLVKAFSKESPEQVLTPVMPGVNIPWSQVLYYFVALLVSGVFHEVGHAIAAVREQVRVNGFGLFLMAIYPGAFVDLHTEHLTVISSVRQLRIYCAGVWHNIVLVVFGLLALWFLPYLLIPFYMTGHGAVVLSVTKDSPLHGSLVKGDKVLSLYGCQVYNQQDWNNCIMKTLQFPQHGYCSDMITISRRASFHTLGEVDSGDGFVDCCRNATSSRFCFKYESISHQKGHVCLPARNTMQTRYYCNSPQDCTGPGDKVCVHPSLDNSTRLIRIIRSAGADVLYVGDPLLLQYTVSVMNYSPRSPLMPLVFPSVIEMLLIYLVSLSGALALLNMVPCYFLDGQWALFALVDYTLSSYIPHEDQRNTFCNIILTFGTLLLISNIILALWTLGSL